MLNIDRKYLMSLDESTLKKTADYHAGHRNPAITGWDLLSY